MLTLENNLPKQYRILNHISNVSLRYNLIERIDAIITLLEECRHLKFSDRTNNLLNRFFTYFDNCCLNLKTLEKRAKWNLRYATCVYEHLLCTKHGMALSSQILERNEDDSFGIVLYDFITALCCYCIAVNASSPFTEINQYSISNFLNYASRIQGDSNDLEFISINSEIVDLTNFLSRLVRTRTILENNDTLYFQINTINNKMDLYLRHQLRKS